MSGNGEGDFNAILLQVRHRGASLGLCIKNPSGTTLLPPPALAGAGTVFILELRSLGCFLFRLETLGCFVSGARDPFGLGLGICGAASRFSPVNESSELTHPDLAQDKERGL